MSETCLICLENSAINITNVSTLIKICDCKYLIHKECIHKWLIKEPVCLICKKLMIYESEKLPVSVTVSVPNENTSIVNVENGMIDVNNYRFKKKVYMVLIVLISVLIIVVPTVLMILF